MYVCCVEIKKLLRHNINVIACITAEDTSGVMNKNCFAGDLADYCNFILIAIKNYEVKSNRNNLYRH